jgi:biopolymer transport protein ExbB
MWLCECIPAKGLLGMLYDLIGRFAGIGGECALAVLFVVSIVSLALICDRVWYFVQRHLDVDLFAGQLAPLLRAHDWSGAQDVAQQSPASPALTVLAGLSQVDFGPQAVQAVMRSAAARERLRLDAHLGLLRSLGLAALLVGLLGTVFDLWEFLNSPGVSNSGKTLMNYNAISVLAPLAAGLLAATPAFFAASILTSHVQKTMNQIEFITEFVMAQLTADAGVGSQPKYSARAA